MSESGTAAKPAMSVRLCLQPLLAGAIKSSVLAHQLGISEPHNFQKADTMLQLTNAVLTRVRELTQIDENEQNQAEQSGTQ